MGAASDWDAIRDHCLLVDVSAHARLIGTGPDLIGLLQRLSTNDLRDIEDGGGRSTVLTSAKGRIVQRLFVHPLGDRGVLLVAGPGAAATTLAHLQRYTFAEQTGLSDATETTCQLALAGPRTDEVLGALGWSRPAPYGTVVVEDPAPSGEGDPGLVLLGQDGESADGVSLVAPRDRQADLRTRLAAAVETVGGRLAGDTAALDAWRVVRGVPVAGAELAEEHNPLEVGLWDAVSFDKGCYVGQEVVARLNTYDKVSRELLRVDLDETSDLPEGPAPLFLDGRGIGSLTRWCRMPDDSGIRGVALVKKRFEAAGRSVRVGGPDGVEARLNAYPSPDAAA